MWKSCKAPARPIPGLALAFGVVGLFALNPESELSAALRVFVLTWFLYRIGSALDRPFLDGLYGALNSGTASAWDRWRLKRLFRYQPLEQRRDTAQRALGLPTGNGLYKKAVAALNDARITDIKVYSTLQYSMAARQSSARSALSAMFIFALNT